ncbi:calcium-binding protein [Enterovibrio calviensis]|uniref:hypothetical protein n=1 Tax=Enterovibrio calviensis TaxID=91359 RepID=UPI000482237E|nr:hypothetical protein [Enterovibrio calviensis]
MLKQIAITSTEKISPSSQADAEVGGTGYDFISGGSGNDVLWGGTHADTFHFARWDGHNVIKDFSLSQGDKIQIDASLATNIAQVYSWQNGSSAELYIDYNVRISIDNFSVSDINNDMFSFS